MSEKKPAFDLPGQREKKPGREISNLVHDAVAPKEDQPPVYQEKAYGRACAECHFFGVMPNGSTVCRRHPPKQTAVAMAAPDGNIMWRTTTAWPWVAPNEWCGEFAKRPEG